MQEEGNNDISTTFLKVKFICSKTRDNSVQAMLRVKKLVRDMNKRGKYGFSKVQRKNVTVKSKL